MLVVKILCNKTTNHPNKCLNTHFKGAPTFCVCVCARSRLHMNKITLSHMRNQMSTAVFARSMVSVYVRVCAPLQPRAYMWFDKPIQYEFTSRHTLIRNPDRDIVRWYLRRHLQPQQRNNNNNFEEKEICYAMQSNITVKLFAHTVYAADFSLFKCACKQLA